MFTRVPVTETVPFTRNFQIDFFIMQPRKIADIFPKNPLKNVPCGNIQNCFWLGVVIELISGSWKVIASCADLNITDIFFSCKRVNNE